MPWPTCEECGRKHEQAPNNPCRSSGALWTDEEDTKLEFLLMELMKEFPDRSIAAVLSRIEWRKLAIYRRYSA